MDLRGLLRPVGHLPAGIYWRRRVIVSAVGLVALILLWNVVSPGGSNSARSASPSGHASTPASAGEHSTAHTVATAPTHTAPPAATHPPAATTHRSATGTCASGSLAVAVTVDHTAFPAGVAPRFVMTIANRSSSSCRVDVGPSVRAFTVYSGHDRIWSTADCTGTGHVVTTLRPRQQLAYAVVWQRHRSAAHCPTGTAAALPGYYRVSASIGSLQSSEAAFSLS